MENRLLYFSDFFNVDEDIIDGYGAVNISLINDLPLFIDPFLLFNSEKAEYQAIHSSMIDYLLFLQSQAEKFDSPQLGMLSAWFMFSEIKQTWLGFSLGGNSGRGLGKDFAGNLYNGLRTIFKDFGKETIPKSPHIEKLCLISPLVGRDKISDFTTNFAKGYLLDYTARFASEYLDSEQCAVFTIPKVIFRYDTMAWQNKEYVLPSFNNDFVLLTPKDLLTREDTFINRVDMINNLRHIAPSVEDAALRFQLNHYLLEVLPKKKKEMTKTEKKHAAISLITSHPELIDHYLKYKEDNEQQATSISKEMVREATLLFNNQLQELVTKLASLTPFYSLEPTSYDAVYNRVLYLKNVIENKDGYRLFYMLVWYATSYDVNREVNNGRGPVDFKISRGSIDKSLVEFKLASNTKLKHNLAKQVEVYKKANNTDRAIKVILFFTDTELYRVNTILNSLGLQNCRDIVLIDARDNKLSASNVRIEE